MFNYFILKEIENGNASLDLNVLHSSLYTVVISCPIPLMVFKCKYR